METTTTAPARRGRGRPPRAKVQPPVTTAPETVGQLVDSLPPITASQPAMSAVAPPPVAATATERPPLRAPVREEDPRAAAARRTAEIMGHLPEGVDTQDKFYFDISQIPDGWTYEWKTWSIYGKEDPQRQVAYAQTGWTAVPASRHIEMMPTGFKGATIDRDGLRLMERPAAVTEHYQAIDRRRAREQVRTKEEQLSAAPPGQFDRTSDPRVRPNVKKTMEYVPIPQES